MQLCAVEQCAIRLPYSFFQGFRLFIYLFIYLLCAFCQSVNSVKA